MDDVEKIFPAKKKKGGKKTKDKKKKATDSANPTRIKKNIGKWRIKWIDDKTRITIIGCSSQPEEGSKKEFRKFFDKSIYFPFPDYSTRRIMWMTFIKNNNGTIKSEFPLSTLAHISSGFSAGSIKQTVESVLTPYRVS